MSRLTFLTTLLFASRAILATADATAPQNGSTCLFGTPGWSPSNEDWVAAGTDAWTTNWWNSQTAANKSLGFATLLGRVFIPTDPSWGCNIGETASCVVSDCELVETGGNPAPYFVLLSLQYFTQQMNDLYQALYEGVASAETNEVGFSTTFSNPLASDSSSIGLKEFINALNYIIFAGLAAMGATAPLSVIGTAMAGGIESSSPFVPSSDPDAYTLQEMEIFGQFLSQFLNQSATAIGTMTSNLLLGQTDSQGNHIWDWFKNATFASMELSPQDEPNAIGSQEWATSYMSTMATAGGVNALWKANNVYIVAASAQNGDCESDNRVPSEVKYCRTDTSDGNVYAIYTIANGKVQAPPGYDKLSSNGNMTLGQAVLSSIKAYEAAKFNYANVQGARWVDASLNWGVGNRPMDLWASFEGVFTIAVCSDSSGDSLASLGESQRFPCSCGSNGDESGAFRAASKLETIQSYLDYCGEFNPSALSSFAYGPPGSPYPTPGSKFYEPYH